MPKEDVDVVIDNIILALNKMNDKFKGLENQITTKLIELDMGITNSRGEIQSLLSGIVDLLTDVTQKEYRVNDLILAITEVVASHKLKRNEAGDLGDGDVLKV